MKSQGMCQAGRNLHEIRSKIVRYQFVTKDTFFGLTVIQIANYHHQRLGLVLRDGELFRPPEACKSSYGGNRC
jgi:hypothetical protein